jgi:NADH:ubiquinone reductase (non-electrogenic)
LQQSFRRTYADAPKVELSPEPKPRRRFRIFRWTWRLTYLSVLAGLGYVSYQVYDLRHPSDQVDPDPSKKTLVILGLSLFLTDALSETNAVQVPAGAPYLS